jgi:GAF domain-containing protein
MALDERPRTDIREGEFVNLLGSLQSLLLTGPRLEDFLGELARLAADVVQPSASCGITTRYDNRPRTVASSDPRAALIDEEQYAAGAGPCIESLDTGGIVEIDDQEADLRWPSYRKQALDLGVQCSLSLPLVVAGQTVGAMNLYGYDRPHAFDNGERRRAETFAAQASTALALAVRHTEQTELTDQLAQALSSRTLIDQALGILMAQQRCDADDAFELLRRHSQSNNRKLRDVAADLITRVSGKPPAPPQPFET